MKVSLGCFLIFNDNFEFNKKYIIFKHFSNYFKSISIRMKEEIEEKKINGKLTSVERER